MTGSCCSPDCISRDKKACALTAILCCWADGVVVHCCLQIYMGNSMTVVSGGRGHKGVLGATHRICAHCGRMLC
jgi:hypothetical protein